MASVGIRCWPGATSISRRSLAIVGEIDKIGILAKTRAKLEAIFFGGLDDSIHRSEPGNYAMKTMTYANGEQ